MKVREGGSEETSNLRDQGRPGEATSRQRAGAVTLRSHPEPEAMGGSWEEPPTPEARAGGRRSTRGAVAEQAQEGLEEPSHVEGWEQQR